MHFKKYFKTSLMLVLMIEVLAGCAASVTYRRKLAVSNAQIYIPEANEKVVTLSYTSYSNFVASECTVTGLTNLSMTTACTCDAIGVCTVGVTPTFGYYGDAQFNYTIGNGRLTSNSSTYSVKVLESERTSGGKTFSCAINAADALYCWGQDTSGQLGNGAGAAIVTTPTQIETDKKFISVSAGYRYACAIDTSLNLYCWGYNFYGQLGIGTTGSTNAPQLVGADYIKVTVANSNMTCGLKVNGEVYCWGDNAATYGSGIGNGTNQASSPELIGTGFKTVTVGDFHACGAKTNGDLYCWGSNVVGQIADAATYGADAITPAIVTGVSNVKRIALDAFASCAINASNELYCWGFNERGNLGDGSTVNSAVPLLIGNQYLVISKSSFWPGPLSHESHTCGLKENQDLYCWGANLYGQVGDGTTTDRYTPTYITSDVKHMDIGQRQNIFIKNSGELFGFGFNSNNQLGDGTTTDRWSPVSIGSGF